MYSCRLAHTLTPRYKHTYTQTNVYTHTHTSWAVVFPFWITNSMCRILTMTEKTIWSPCLFTQLSPASRVSAKKIFSQKSKLKLTWARSQGSLGQLNSTMQKLQSFLYNRISIGCNSADKSTSTTKGGSGQLEKSHKVWMIMMIAASLIWAGAAEKPEQFKMTFKNHQNDAKQLV